MSIRNADRTTTLTVVTYTGSVYVFTTAHTEALTYDMHVVKSKLLPEGSVERGVTIITPKVGEMLHVTRPTYDRPEHVLRTSPVTHILRTDLFGEALPSDPYAEPETPAYARLAADAVAPLISGDERDIAQIEALLDPNPWG